MQDHAARKPGQIFDSIRTLMSIEPSPIEASIQKQINATPQPVANIRAYLKSHKGQYEGLVGDTYRLRKSEEIDKATLSLTEAVEDVVKASNFVIRFADLLAKLQDPLGPYAGVRELRADRVFPMISTWLTVMQDYHLLKTAGKCALDSDSVVDTTWIIRSRPDPDWLRPLHSELNPDPAIFTLDPRLLPSSWEKDYLSKNTFRCLLTIRPEAVFQVIGPNQMISTRPLPRGAAVEINPFARTEDVDEHTLEARCEFNISSCHVCTTADPFLAKIGRFSSGGQFKLEFIPQINSIFAVLQVDVVENEILYISYA